MSNTAASKRSASVSSFQPDRETSARGASAGLFRFDKSDEVPSVPDAAYHPEEDAKTKGRAMLDG